MVQAIHQTLFPVPIPYIEEKKRSGNMRLPTAIDYKGLKDALYMKKFRLSMLPLSIGLPVLVHKEVILRHFKLNIFIFM